MSSKGGVYDGRYVAAAALAGAAVGAAALSVLTKREKQRLGGVGDDVISVEKIRDKNSGVVGRWTKPVVVHGPGLADLAKSLGKRLGSDEYAESAGPTISWEKFKSGDPDVKFNWQRIVGRKVVYLFDTVNQEALFQQLALLQAFQGFAVPDGEDKGSKWKTYVHAGKYAWGRASSITVVIPWYRPCQMERTSRWGLQDGKWTNGDQNGSWLDVPTAQYYARLLSTPGSVPPLPGPSCALDSMPLSPLWRPPLELLFVELHEEKPISHSVSDLGATIRTERFVPYFLDKFKAKASYPGRGSMYVLFPDHGAYDRYQESVVQRLKLDADHILYIKKTRVGESTSSEQKLFYYRGASSGEKQSFSSSDTILIIDDFTNSGGTLFNAVSLCQTLTQGGSPNVSILVSHLVAGYDPKAVIGIKEKIHALGKNCTFYTTNSIKVTTDVLKGDSQCEVFDLSDLIADLVI